MIAVFCMLLQCCGYVLSNCRTRSVNISFLNDEDSSLITITSLRLLADLYFGPIDHYTFPSSHFQRFEVRSLRHFIDCLQPGVSIFVQTDWLSLFFQKFYPLISVPFVLISGASDASVPNGISLHFFLKPESKILHWYGQNCERNPNPKRFTCLMLGLSDTNFWESGHKGMTAAEVLLKNFSNHIVTGSSSTLSRPVKKNPSYDVLVPHFTLYHTFNITDRNQVINLFCGRHRKVGQYLNKNPSNVTAFCGAHVSLVENYQATLQSSFVFSPHGHGLDCYRTWETLYLGAYPIVRTSALDEMYVGLPVLIVKEWEEVTIPLLLMSYYNFTRTPYTFEKLRLEYWHSTFSNHGYVRQVYWNEGEDSLVRKSAAALLRLKLKNGDLIKNKDYKLVYLIQNFTRRPILHLKTFFENDWDFKDVKKLSTYDINEIIHGTDFI